MIQISHFSAYAQRTENTNPHVVPKLRPPERTPKSSQVQNAKHGIFSAQNTAIWEPKAATHDTAQWGELLFLMLVRHKRAKNASSFI